MYVCMYVCMYARIYIYIYIHIGIYLSLSLSLLSLSLYIYMYIHIYTHIVVVAKMCFGCPLSRRRLHRFRVGKRANQKRIPPSTKPPFDDL